MGCSNDLKIEETFWISMNEKWNMKDEHEEMQRIGSAHGQIIYFGNGNNFYYLTGLLDLYAGNIVDIDIYEDYNIGFLGKWKVIGNSIELTYSHFPNKYARRPLTQEFSKRVKSFFKTKIKVVNDHFMVKYFDFGERLFYTESKFGVKVNGSMISEYFGKEHTTNRNIVHEPKKKIENHYFYFCFSPDEKELIVANSVNVETIRLEIRDVENKIVSKVRKIVFEPVFLESHIKEPDKVEWYNDKIVFVYNKRRIIFYKNGGLIEITNFLESKKRYYDYLHLQIDQVYNNLSSKDRMTFKEIVGPYLGMRIKNNFYRNAKIISEENWKKIGSVFWKMIKDLKNKYKNKLAFQIFERAFNQHFNIENDKVLFNWK
jgi:hypothetical protein